MRVLITGATGCLGRLLRARLAEDPHVELLLTSRSRLGEPNHTRCDLAEADAVKRLIAETRPDRVFHLAGSRSGDYEQDRAVNAEAARWLCEAVRQQSLACRVILIGSAAEYGLVHPSENPLSETRSVRPASVYGLTKAFQTQIASLYATGHGMDVVVARMFNLLAPGLAEHLFVGRAERLIAKYRRGEVQRLSFANLSARRDYVTGADAVTQLLLIASKGRAGEVYHIASGRAVQVRDLLMRMLSEAGIKPEVVREDEERSAAMGAEIPVIYADLSKTKALANA